MQGELHVKWKPDVFLRILNNNLRLCAGSVPLCVIEHWIFQILQWQNISRITNVFTDHAEREQLQPDLPRRHLQRAAEKRWISLVKVCQLAEKTGDDELWWLLLHLLNPFHFFYSDLQWTPRVSVVNALLRVSCRTLTVTHFQFLYCSFALLSAATIEPPSQNQDNVSYIFNMGNGNDWPLCGVIGYG